MEDLRRFKIGDVVTLKKDAEVGNWYYNETDEYCDRLTSTMRNNLKGKELAIVELHEQGYILSGGSEIYFAEMLDLVTDSLASKPYTFNREVEKLTRFLELKHILKYVDDALDKGDEEEFKRLTKMYREKDLEFMSVY
jgi:uncharacterized protein YbgA (DUF1722 family)